MFNAQFSMFNTLEQNIWLLIFLFNSLTTLVLIPSLEGRMRILNAIRHRGGLFKSVPG